MRKLFEMTLGWEVERMLRIPSTLDPHIRVEVNEEAYSVAKRHYIGKARGSKYSPGWGKGIGADGFKFGKGEGK